MVKTPDTRFVLISETPKNEFQYIHRPFGKREKQNTGNKGNFISIQDKMRQIENKLNEENNRYATKYKIKLGQKNANLITLPPLKPSRNDVLNSEETLVLSPSGFPNRSGSIKPIFRGVDEIK